MAKMDWEYIFSRRRWRLENYLSDCVTVQDALNKFDRAEMTAPDLEMLLSYGLKKTDTNLQTEESPTVSASTSSKPKASPKSKSTGKAKKDEVKEEYDELVVLPTDE